MRFLILLLPALGCASRTPAPTPTPKVSTAASECPPLGRWTLAAAAPKCTHDQKLVFDVAAGAPTQQLVLPPGGEVVASGRTDTGQPYETMLVVTDPRGTGVACEMKLHLEYMGPHAMLTHDVTAHVTDGRLEATGTFNFAYDAPETVSCQPDDPSCVCSADVTITGEVQQNE